MREEHLVLGGKVTISMGGCICFEATVIHLGRAAGQAVALICPVLSKKYGLGRSTGELSA